MNQRKTHEELSILEAVDNLSSMVELDAAKNEDENIPFEEVGEIVEEKKGVKWLDPRHIEENKQIVKETFRAIHNYLKHVYEHEKDHLHDVETQKGIQAIMVLAGEAAQKLDKYTTLFKGAAEQEGIAQVKEYQELQHFYATKMMKKFQKALESEESWQAEWGNAEENYLDVQRRSLKDLETVRRDKEYELFYIKKEDGRPFFNKNLLRHIRLVGDFDQIISDPTGEDPFLRVKVIQDKDMHFTAKEILYQISPYLDEFYKEAMRHKNDEFTGSLNKAIMALMLASNSRNLMQNTTGKSCISYYLDFHTYLRRAISSAEYQKFIEHPPETSDHFSICLLNLSHALCSHFFTRVEKREETMQLIHRLIKKGEQNEVKKPSLQTSLSFWNNLLESDEYLRFLLKHYPNGPILKTLDTFRLGQQKEGFDPVAQENLPSQLFTFSLGDLHVTCLKVPSPTHQQWINRAEVIEEFRGFLRYLSPNKAKQKHLLINMQDRTSWQEHARCMALEDLQKQAEFSENLIVVTLPKSTDFYLQASHYQHLNQADLFLQQFKDQIASGEECGFYFPSFLKTPAFQSFIDETLSMIHQVFFTSKNVLTRKNRLDFIEVFYQFIYLKLVDLVHPDSISFTCKDTIDVGAATAAGFYSFLKGISEPDQQWTAENKDFLIWMLYSSALMIRERPIDLQRLHRIISALAVIYAEIQIQRTRVLETIQPLFKIKEIGQIRVAEIVENRDYT